ncbi:MAG: hypothetical protein A2W80_03775 [Candidatus Riflebacteria bacterium GWC2_50_8]|nr:MAG: hypothetical protein A2W80_03775 [Candidatus Riflebacteria bacterium GWC2_50_8]
MSGREDKKDNDLFFVCSLIEYIARKTKNTKADVVSAIGKNKLMQILKLADVYHSENIAKLSEELVRDYNIKPGHFDNLSNCLYSVPTHWDIGKVYKRLLLEIEKETGADIIDLLANVFSSPIAQKIDDFNSSMYYESPEYIYESYKQGKPCEE